MPKFFVYKPTEKHKGYFEAVIQLRPFHEEALSLIRNMVNKRADVFVSSVDDVKGGVDVKISSQRFARTIGRKLAKTFKGELKVTRTLYSKDRQSSKEIYRGTVLFRFDPSELHKKKSI